MPDLLSGGNVQVQLIITDGRAYNMLQVALAGTFWDECERSAMDGLKVWSGMLKATTLHCVQGT